MDEAEVSELQEELTFLKDRNVRLNRQNAELKERIAALQKELSEVRRELDDLRILGARRQKNQSWRENYEKVAQLMREGVPAVEARKRLGMSRSTYYRYAKEYKKRVGEQSEK